MDKQIEQLKLADKLAREILSLSRNTLLVNLRFLENALYRFTPVVIPSGSIATDGELLFYDMRWVLSEYTKEKEYMTRAYLHLVMHCIFRHMFVSPTVERDIWDLACDIAVENVINSLVIPCIGTAKSRQQAAMISELNKSVKQLTAEKIYRHYLEKALTPKELAELRILFYTDDHAVWYMGDEAKGSYGGRGQAEQPQPNSSGPQSESKPQNNDEPQDNRDKPQSKPDSGDGNPPPEAPNDPDMPQPSPAPTPRRELSDTWKNVAEHIQLDLETFGKNRGYAPGGMLQELTAVNRERYDYAEFLRRFSTLGEVMQLDHDEFDYIFYTYGLKLYDNIPLIEPLEYKEVKRIKEFVIAIDTSGSTSGQLVQKFINKTYNILKQQESFFTKINLHILQCDAAIQEDAKITSQEEFDEYLKTMKLRGMGGTDFRPVFDYVDGLIRAKEFTNLKGLIYFTDGCGTFPERRPNYDAAFVFVDDDYNDYDVPVWAIKLILQRDEI